MTETAIMWYRPELMHDSFLFTFASVGSCDHLRVAKLNAYLKIRDFAPLCL